MNNKVVRFAMLYLSLLILETICCFLFVLFIYEGFDLKGSFDASILWNLWRVIFFGVPFIVIYFLSRKHFENIKFDKPIKISIFNTFLYILLSVLSKIIWGNNIPLPPEGSMFWSTCIATIISPIILGQIQYFRKLM